MHATRPHYPKPTMGELSPPAIDPCDRQRGCVGVSIFREDLCRGAADLLYQMMLFWESCRGAGQKVLCSLQELPRFAKGHQIPGHTVAVASGAGLPRTSTNSSSSHTSSRKLFRCSRAQHIRTMSSNTLTAVLSSKQRRTQSPGPISPLSLSLSAVHCEMFAPPDRAAISLELLREFQPTLVDCSRRGLETSLAWALPLVLSKAGQRPRS
jgi:hypothetical protein